MNISWLQRFLSYFFVITIEKIQSDFNPGLCLQLEAGKILLNTKNANYSFGNLHKVFVETFKKINLKNNTPKNVLLLGLGTGSVIYILQKDYNIFPEITAVEIDPVIVDVFKKTNISNLEKTKIICGDAFEVIKNIETKFDLLIVDLFIDLEVPEQVYDKDFLLKIKDLMSPKSIVAVNCVVNTNLKKTTFDEFKITLSKYFGNIKIHEIMGINRVVELRN